MYHNKCAQSPHDTIASLRTRSSGMPKASWSRCFVPNHVPWDTRKGGVQGRAGGAAGLRGPSPAHDPPNGPTTSKIVLPNNDHGQFGKVYGAYLGNFGRLLIRIAPLKARFLPFFLSRLVRAASGPIWAQKLQNNDSPENILRVKSWN